MGAAGRGGSARRSPGLLGVSTLVAGAASLLMAAVALPAQATPGTFSDVSPTHVFHTEITWASGQSIVTGYDDGSFRPQAAVTRQAMAAFLFRFANATDDAPPDASFTDVSTAHPFFGEIEWLAAEGITTGYDDGTFRPSLAVSRQAMAAYLYRIAGAPPAPANLSKVFSDVGRDHRFFVPITFLWDFGLAEGYTGGRFLPLIPVSRAATTAFLYRTDQVFGRFVADSTSAAGPTAPRPVWIHRGR